MALKTQLRKLYVAEEVTFGVDPDADGSDDGVTVPLVLPSGRKTTFDYVVTVVSPAATRLYANFPFRKTIGLPARP